MTSNLPQAASLLSISLNSPMSQSPQCRNQNNLKRKKKDEPPSILITLTIQLLFFLSKAKYSLHLISQFLDGTSAEPASTRCVRFSRRGKQ